MKTLFFVLLLPFAMFFSTEEKTFPFQTSIQLQQPTVIPGSQSRLRFNWTRPTTPDPEDPSCTSGPVTLDIYLVSPPAGGTFSGLRYYEFQQMANRGQLVKSFTGITGNVQQLRAKDVLPGRMHRFAQPNTYYVAQVRCAGPGRSNYVGFKFYGITRPNVQMKPGIQPIGSPMLRRSGGA